MKTLEINGEEIPLVEVVSALMEQLDREELRDLAEEILRVSSLEIEECYMEREWESLIKKVECPGCGEPIALDAYGIGLCRACGMNVWVCEQCDVVVVLDWEGFGSCGKCGMQMSPDCFII